MNKTRKNISFIYIYINIILFCIYIFPSGILQNGIIISKYIFLFSSTFIYLIDIARTKTIKIMELLYLSFILIYSFFVGNFEFLMFLTLPLLYRFINYKEYIKDYLLNNKFKYICLLFTIIYSLLFFGYGGRYAFTSIKEINQSGLAIFCLGCLLYYNNKKIGIFTFLLGLLTISRSYYLALILFVLYNKYLKDKIRTKLCIIKFFNYRNLTIITSFALVILGYIYLIQYYNGNIFWGDKVSNRLINIFDASNFFRFTAVINLINVIKMRPDFLLTGMNQENYIKYGILSAQKLKIPYRQTVPHNLFFSHLKIYGIFSFFETIIISKIISQITSKSNYGIFLGIVLYSCFLGAGFYSYWIFLTSFLLIVYQKEEVNEN